MRLERSAFGTSTICERRFDRSRMTMLPEISFVTYSTPIRKCESRQCDSSLHTLTLPAATDLTIPTPTMLHHLRPLVPLLPVGQDQAQARPIRTSRARRPISTLGFRAEATSMNQTLLLSDSLILWRALKIEKTTEHL